MQNIADLGASKLCHKVCVYINIHTYVFFVSVHGVRGFCRGWKKLFVFLCVLMLAVTCQVPVTCFLVGYVVLGIDDNFDR